MLSSISNTSLTEMFGNIDKVVSLFLSGYVACFIVLYFIAHFCWLTYLIRDCRSSNRYAARIESQEGVLSPDSIVIVDNFRFNCKKDKLLIMLIITEALSIVSFFLAFSYHLIRYVNPRLIVTGLSFNSTCIEIALENKIWVDALRYPTVGFLLSFGRSMVLVALGIGDCLLKIIANTYVTQSWRYKRVYLSLNFAVFLSILLVIFGTIPQTSIFNNFLNVFAFFVLLKLIFKHLSFLSNKALEWREQDMLNNVIKQDILIHRRKKKRFLLFSHMLFLGLVLFFIVELSVSLECVIELFLYFGKCIFPALYGISFTPPITHEQIPQFHLALLIISTIEKLIFLLGLSISFAPLLFYTVVSGVREALKQRRRNLDPFRFRGNAHSKSEMTRPLI